MRDTVNEHRIRDRLVHPRAAEFRIFRHDTLVAAIDFLDKLWRERPLTPDNEPNFQRHGFYALKCDVLILVMVHRAGTESYGSTKPVPGQRFSCSRVCDLRHSHLERRSA